MKPFQFWICASVLATASPGYSESEIEQEIATLREEVASLKEEASRLDTLEGNMKLIEDEISKAKEEFPELEAELATMEKLRDIYRSAFRVVSSIDRGSSLGEMTLKDGSAVSGAVLVGASGGGISVETSSGPRTITPDLLPDEVRSAFTFPPSNDEPKLGYTELIAGKPEIAKTEEEKAAELAAIQSQSMPAAATATSSAPAQNSTKATDAAKDREGLLARNAERQKQVDALRARYTEVSKQKKLIIADRAAQSAKFRSSNIKTAQSEVNKVMDVFKAKIDRLDAQEDQIRDQISKLQSEWE